MRPDTHRYFSALGLSPGASANDIRVAYRKRIQAWHPDRFAAGSLMQTTAEDQTKELNEAYEWLYKKRHYRKFLAENRQRQAPPVARPVEPEPAADPGVPPRPAAAPRPASRRSVIPPVRAWFRRQGRKIMLAVGIAGVAGLLCLAGPRLARLWPSTPAEAAAPAHPATADVAKGAAPVVSPVAPPAEAPVRGPEPVAAGRPAAKPELASLAAPSAALASSVRPSGTGAEVVPASARERGIPPAGEVSARPAFVPDRRPPPGAGVVTLPAAEASPPAAAQEEARDRMLDAAEAEMETFEIGDLPGRVTDIQGRPDEAGPGVYRYGSSVVFFSHGRVSSWISRVPRLRIPRLWSIEVTDDIDAFTVGSTRGEVFRIQGRPDGVMADAYFYGSDVVYFANDRVVDWTRTDGRLRTRVLPELPLGN